MCLLAGGSLWIYSNLSLLRGFIQFSPSLEFPRDRSGQPLPSSVTCIAQGICSINSLEVHHEQFHLFGAHSLLSIADQRILQDQKIMRYHSFLKLHSLQFIYLSSSKAKLPSLSPIKNKQLLTPKGANIQSISISMIKSIFWESNRLSISIMKWNIFKRLITFHISFLIQSCQYSRNI